MFDAPDVAQKWLGLFATLGAERALSLLDSAETPALPEASVMEVVEAHIRTLSGVTDGTASSYLREARRDIAPRLGKIPFRALDRDDVTSWVMWMRREGGVPRGCDDKARRAARQAVQERVTELGLTATAISARGSVTRQAISLWLRGESWGRPSTRAAIETAVGWPTGRIEQLAAAASGAGLRLPGPGLSPKTIANRHGLLSAVCADAVRRGIRPDNPCEGVGLPRGIDQEMVILTADEVAELVEAIDPRYQDLIIVLVGTGIRWSEATALEGRHVLVDLAHKVATIRIAQAWKDVDSGPMQLGPPKTPRSRRTITLDGDSPAFDALARAVRGKRATDRVFTSPRGAVLRNATFHSRQWPAAMAKLAAQGWEKRPRPHDLRHTAATMMLAGGADIEAVSRVLGHEKTSTTLDVYGHAMPGAAAAALGTLSAALGSVLGARPQVSG